ncbi:MAG TPA: 3'(2'),5'-bisphosphate nucleotidase CysQ, partial [Ilumatobacteraceae bacterium]|nr:3'(2'),5'-bisphosphate nucleotidase CysQ [Ilumatobacteraceae bacterium]
GHTGSVIHPDDHVVARALATEAGEILRSLRAVTPVDELKATGDAASHELLMRRLAELRPDDRVLSEESAAKAAGSATGRVWIVDPLDGTREFGEPPRSDWAVHVALVVDGVPVVGAVALPGRDLTLATGTDLPAPVIPTDGARPRLLVSRTRPAAHAQELAARIDAELVPLGSAGAKAMAVVLGEADVYAHSGGQYEWDSAAPVAVALAAGFHASRLDGTPLVYDQSDPWLPDLLVCRPDLAPAVLAACAALN